MPDVVIDGVPYAPVTDIQPKIGIGITTHNRLDAFNKSYDEIKRLAPAGSKIVVVDDASSKPVPEATFRFEENVGIARAKNKCLELLQECEHIFLFDDDIYPLVEDWWKPYVRSPEPHLMWIFDRPQNGKRQLELLYKDSNHVAYHSGRGVMLYVHRSVLDVVGGMDPRFGKWGWEHISWSDRIHAAGLTTWRYADVANSQSLFYSLDERGAIQSTVTPEAKRFSSGPGSDLRMRSRHSAKYIEYREPRNVVITTLLTKQVDPQRGRHMSADVRLLQALCNSIKDGWEFIVLHDSLKDPTLDKAQFVHVDSGINPYFQRHLSAFQWLRDNRDIGFAWCVDGTDVEMLRDPIKSMRKGVLYLGSEPTTLTDEWMLKNHPDTKIQEFFKANPNLQLLNAGLIGGDRETVMRFLQAMTKEYFDDHIDYVHGWEKGRVGVGDMGVLNLVAREKFGDRLEYGPHINTVFKAEDRANKIAWWKHK